MNALKSWYKMSSIKQSPILAVLPNILMLFLITYAQFQNESLQDSVLIGFMLVTIILGVMLKFSKPVSYEMGLTKIRAIHFGSYQIYKGVFITLVASYLFIFSIYFGVFGINPELYMRINKYFNFASNWNLPIYTIWTSFIIPCFLCITTITIKQIFIPKKNWHKI